MGNITLAYDVFISYNSNDYDSVNLLAIKLTHEYGLNVWMDRDRLRPGVSWRVEIEEAMENSASVMIVWGPGGLGPIQLQERDLAYVIRDENSEFRVLYTLLPNSQPPKGKWANIDTWVRFQSSLDEADNLALLVSAVKGEVPPTQWTAELPDEPAPYRGMEAFFAEHSRFFFGRTVYIDEMVKRLQDYPFLAILGPSGCGKTSIVQAGLGAKLQSNYIPNSAEWPCELMRPGFQPLKSLATAIRRRLQPDADPLKADDMIFQRLKNSPKEVSVVVPSLVPSNLKFVLIIDRLEELFTLCETEEDGIDFVEALHSLATRPDSPVWILTTMRADFYGHLGRYSKLAPLVTERQMYIKPMGQDEVLEVIQAPAAQVGASFEKGLAHQIRKDAQARGEVPLPLLEHTLDLLWRDRRGRWLTWDTYRTIGGVTGALEYHADRIINALNIDEQEIASRLLTRLVRLEESSGAIIAGRRVEKRALFGQHGDEKISQDILERLANARLITLRVDGEHATTELVHDTLPLNWDQLKTWVKKDQEFLLWHQRIRTDLKRWEQTSDDESALLRGVPLMEAKRWFKERADEISRPEVNFIEKSIQQQKRKEQRKQLINISIVTSGFIVAVIFFYLWNKAELSLNRADRLLEKLDNQLIETEKHRDIALQTDSLRIASLSVKKTEGDDYRLGILLALHALPEQMAKPNRPYVAEAEAALYRALQIPRVIDTLEDHEAPVLSVVFSSNGKWFASASSDGLVRIWDVADSKTANRFELKGHNTPVRHLSFTPNDNLLVSVSEDGSVCQWDVTEGSQIGKISIPDDFIEYIAISPDGFHIATASSDHIVRLWDLKTGKAIHNFEGHTKTVVSIDFDDRRGRLLTASIDGTVRRWDISGERELTPSINCKFPLAYAALSPNQELIVATSEDGIVALHRAEDGSKKYQFRLEKRIKHAAFSSVGEFLAIASDDKTTRILDIDRKKEVAKLVGHNGPIEQVAFSSDDRKLATASRDTTLRLWDVSMLRSEMVLDGHEGAINSAVFLVGREQLATASADNTIRIWNIDSGRFTPLIGHEDVVSSIAYCNELGVIASGGSDKTVRLWNAEKGPPDRILWTHTSPATSVDFSPDGCQLSAAFEDGLILLFDVKSNSEPITLNGHNDRVNHIEYSPDGQRLISYGSDPMAILWNTNDGSQLKVFEGVYQFSISHSDFSPDGRYLAITFKNGTAELWDTERWIQVADLPNHGYLLNDVIFHPYDSRRLLTATNDGMARLLVWNGQRIVEIATFEAEFGSQIKNEIFNKTGDQIALSLDNGSALVFNIFPTTQAIIDYASRLGLAPFTEEEKEELFIFDEQTKFASD